MRLRTVAILLVGAVLVGGVVAYKNDLLHLVQQPSRAGASAEPIKPPQGVSVTVVRAGIGEFVDTVLVTGTLVPREEILVGPEVEGLRVTEVLADEGDWVKQGQVLARLVSDTLDAQLAQNDAALARAEAAIAQARSSIFSAEARLEEARNALERGKPLSKSGVISESSMDQREAAARTTEASLSAAKEGLKVAEAEKAQVAAQRRELDWRRSRTEITAPRDGIISRRVARVGAYAAGLQDAMFRIVARGEVELDAEVPEVLLTRITAGQPATVAVAGHGDVRGTVRLVSQEIDRSTRLGRVRVSLGNDPSLRIGAFGRGMVETARSRGVSVPVSAVLHGSAGAFVQLVEGERIVTTEVETGIAANGRIEVLKGIAEGALVIAKSGTFLRNGDMVRPVLETAAVPTGSN
jgi:HlyD family secretion protein